MAGVEEYLDKQVAVFEKNAKNDMAEFKEELKNLERVVVARFATENNNNHSIPHPTRKAPDTDRTEPKKCVKMVEDVGGCMGSGGTDC